MRIYVDQVGCRLNYSEMETLAARLAAVGHAMVAAPEAAQVIVFNTCAVTTDASRAGRKRLRQLQRLNPAARLVVTGCWATLEPAAAAALPGVALVVENQRKDLLATLLEPWSAELDDPAQLALLEPDGVPIAAHVAGPLDDDPARAARTRAFVKVQDGCNNRCTFCIVTIARGESRSRRLGDVVAEVQHLAASGVQEAVLTGVHLGSYGRDLPAAERSDLKQLVATLLAHTDIPRLRLSSLEPWELADGFFDLWAQHAPRLCPHLHLPLQAGTDFLLRRMARRCTTASFRNMVAAARASVPDLIVTTDLIVGFPGESDAEFEEGLAFVREMQFADAHIFPFSPRPGTAAAAFTEPVDACVKKERARRLQAVIEETGRRARSRVVGTVRPVLWERPTHPPAGGPLVWTGFTDNYLRAACETPPHVDLYNRITPARLDGLHGDLLLATPLLHATQWF